MSGPEWLDTDYVPALDPVAPDKLGRRIRCQMTRKKTITDAIEAGTPIINLALQMPFTLTLRPKGIINIDSAIAVPGFDKAAIQRAILHAPLRELRLALEVLEAGEEDRVVVAVSAT